MRGDDDEAWEQGVIRVDTRKNLVRIIRSYKKRTDTHSREGSEGDFQQTARLPFRTLFFPVNRSHGLNLSAAFLLMHAG